MSRPAVSTAVLSTTGPSGIRTVWQSYGHGDQTLVVLPGGGQERSRWDNVAKSMAGRGARVAVVDLRGHGDSDRSPTGSYELEDYAADVLPVLLQLGAPLTLAGHSMGGRVALLLARSEQLVRRLVLIDSCPDMPADVSTNAFLAQTVDGFASVEEARQRMEAHFQRTMDGRSIAEDLRIGEDGRYYWHWDAAILDRVIGDLTAETKHLQRAAEGLRIPTLLVRTEHSQFVDDASEQRLRDLVPHLQVETLLGTQHHRPWAAPEVLAKILSRFMNSQTTHPTHLLTTSGETDHTCVNARVDDQGAHDVL